MQIPRKSLLWTGTTVGALLIGTIVSLTQPTARADEDPLVQRLTPELLQALEQAGFVGVTSVTIVDAEGQPRLFVDDKAAISPEFEIRDYELILPGEASRQQKKTIAYSADTASSVSGACRWRSGRRVCQEAVSK